AKVCANAPLREPKGKRRVYLANWCRVSPSPPKAWQRPIQKASTAKNRVSDHSSCGVVVVTACRHSCGSIANSFASFLEAAASGGSGEDARACFRDSDFGNGDAPVSPRWSVPTRPIQV